MSKTVSIINLHAKAKDQKILKGVFLKMKRGEIHAVMGPNGSGKSTLAKVMMGHPEYRVTRGSVLYGKENILKLEPDQRARRGLFMAFQYPVEIPGVNMFSYLRAIYSAWHGKNAIRKINPGKAKHRSEAGDMSVSVDDFQKIIIPIMKNLNMKESFLERSINEGFSGGEKKKAEILQLALLKPKVIILDETDSGLDIDALKIVAKGVKKFRDPDAVVLIITHYQRILKHIKPDKVHIMKAGRIERSGDYTLAKELEKKGYGGLKKRK